VKSLLLCHNLHLQLIGWRLWTTSEGRFALTANDKKETTTAILCRNETYRLKQLRARGTSVAHRDEKPIDAEWLRTLFLEAGTNLAGT
jgi:hypothetical protein